MNWKQILFWSLSAAAIFYYLLLFGVFLFVGQEEMQLFIPEWWFIRESLWQPGGFCDVAGQWIIQYYRQPMLGVVLHSVLLVSSGLMIDKLLCGFSDKSYLSFLSLLPILYLLKMSVHGEYLVDGTVGIVLMLLALLLSLNIRRVRFIIGYGLFSTLFLCGLTGLLSVYYAFLYTLLAFFRYPTLRQRWAAAACLIPAVFIYLFSGWLDIPVPLHEGWRPESYLEIQRLPYYYMYRVWTFFTFAIVGVSLFARIVSRFDGKNKWIDRGAFTVCLLSMSLVVGFCLPESWHVQRMMLDELSFLAREKRWDAIVDKYRGKQIHDYVSLNYLNMSLAQKGELADRMFTFDQKGTKSLCADWNQTFYMDRLLSDVHFFVGDVSLSESFAMDGFTQSKRKGSARLMQRFVQVSLLRGEMGLARKYLDLLATMPFYKDWAKRYATYLANPESMYEEPVLKGKRIRIEKRDRLSLSVPADSLWSGYDLPDNRIGWEYRGCYYLLDKDLDAFSRFLEATPFLDRERMPRHFQEAVLLLADRDRSGLSVYPIQPELVERYRSFKKFLRQSGIQTDVSLIHQQFGDTYWFYYYFKIFKGEEQ